MKHTVVSSDIVQLAAMECAASCILTALNIAGLDYRHFLLGYWNLTYFSKTIMSGKYMIRNDLKFAYGIEQECRVGTASDLMALLRRNHMILLACRASGLRFFPKGMLAQEAGGFQHFILLYGCRSDPDRFLVVDPVAAYIGEMSAADIWECRVKEKELLYYSLSLPPSFEPPSAREMFARESAAIYDRYAGNKAMDSFIRDVADCVNWDRTARHAWIDQNNITISSIVKTRSLVWQSFCGLNVMTGDEMRAGRERLEGVVKLWTAVNFLLIKWKKSDAGETLAASVIQKLEALKSRERECLHFIKEKGREWAAI